MTESHTACGALFCMFRRMFQVMTADTLDRGPNPEARAQLSEITNFDLAVTE